MSYNPEQILHRIRQQQSSEDQQNQSRQSNRQSAQQQSYYMRESQQSLNSQQENQSQYEKNMIEDLIRKVKYLEDHVNNLEENLNYANSEINVLKNQKSELENYVKKKTLYQQFFIQVLKLEVDKNSGGKNKQFEQSSVGQDLVDAISREPVERILQRKERNFNRFGNSNNSQPKTKQAGHLKLDQLNQILNEYPNLVRPVVHVKLTDSDFE